MSTIVTNSLQMQDMSWHRGGLFMGMHWAWWAFWLVLLAILAWALWRVVVDRREMRRAVENMEREEESLRRRFARKEIGEDDYVREMKVLRESLMGR